MPGQQPTRFLFLPATDPVIEQYKEFFKQSVRADTHTISIDVPPEIVNEGYVEMPPQIIMALQHYPQYIEKLLFSIELKFEQVAEGGLYYDEREWKSDPKYLRWYRKMGEFVLTLFFLNDADARFYTLAGDMLADGRMPVVKMDESRGRAKIEASGAVAKEMNSRLHESCILMLYYCYGSGFDPKPYIESVMAEFNAGFDYKSLQEEFEQEVKKGVNVGTTRIMK